MLEGRKPKSVHVVNSALPVHLKSLSKTFLASKDEYGPFLPEKVSQDPRLVTGRGKNITQNRNSENIAKHMNSEQKLHPSTLNVTG